MRTKQELRGVLPGRPWLERAAGECAWPLAGEGAELISCARPAARGGYCAAHRRAMFRPADPDEAREFERLAKRLEGGRAGSGR